MDPRLGANAIRCAASPQPFNKRTVAEQNAAALCRPLRLAASSRKRSRLCRSRVSGAPDLCWRRLHTSAARAATNRDLRGRKGEARMHARKCCVFVDLLSK